MNPRDSAQLELVADQATAGGPPGAGSKVGPSRS